MNQRDSSSRNNKQRMSYEQRQTRRTQIIMVILSAVLILSLVLGLLISV
jgi:predicted nucleic acid-binding Zn ribbon protein